VKVRHAPRRFVTAPEVAILAVVLVATVFVQGTNDFYLRIIELVLIYTMVGMALDLVTGYAGQFSLGHSGLFAVGAYSAVYAYLQMGIPFPFDILFAMLVAAAAGLVVGGPALRLADLYLALATAAFAFIIQLAANDLDWITGGAGGVGGLQPSISHSSYSAWLGDHYLWVVMVVFVVGWLSLRRLTQSRWGRALIAIREAGQVASAVGIGLRSVKLQAFVISAAVTGAAGALFAHLGYVSPDIFQLSLSIAFVTILFLGGNGTLIGSLIGALVVIGVPQEVEIDPNVNNIVYGALLIAVMIVAPRGVVGSAALAFDRLRRSASQPDSPAVRPGPHATAIEEHPAPSGSRRRRGAPASLNGSVRACDISKSFGGLHVLKDIDVHLERGELLGLIGPNGSGKTTFLNILGGQLPADAGSIFLDDMCIGGEGPARRAALGLGRTFQHGGLSGTLTVRENVMLGAHLRGTVGFAPAATLVARRLCEEDELRARADVTLDELGVEKHYRDRRPPELPYGTLRLVEVAVALAGMPRYLLLDEPAAGLAEEEIDRLAGVLDRSVASGVGILLVEHHLGLVLDLADRVVVIESGKLIMTGPPRDVAADPKVLEAYLGPDWARQATEAAQ